MGAVTGMDVSFLDIEGLWEAAVTWVIWLMCNQALFQGSTPYMENIWNSMRSLVFITGSANTGPPPPRYSCPLKHPP
ncbi:hypothetical protein QJS10_CPB20g01131 [Acorus calamus]|uniref:Uncharacterized protein n=1 Tax=Acorus calamus TaxID=4465 RepID=A0AAV9C949_ACOCL|nr:hypothetical protein QJS10_CPB20g01131 [Acorus calamus]